jgi:DNA primase
LYGWLAGYLAADGSVKESGQIRIASAHKSNLEFVRDVCSVLGIGYCPIVEQDRIGIGQQEASTLYSITLNGFDLTEDFFLIEEHRKRFINHKYDQKQDWKIKSVSSDRIEEVWRYCSRNTFVCFGF